MAEKTRRCDHCGQVHRSVRNMYESVNLCRACWVKLGSPANTKEYLAAGGSPPEKPETPEPPDQPDDDGTDPVLVPAGGGWREKMFGSLLALIVMGCAAGATYADEHELPTPKPPCDNCAPLPPDMLPPVPVEPGPCCKPCHPMVLHHHHCWRPLLRIRLHIQRCRLHHHHCH